jgi:hypothetical protein
LADPAEGEGLSCEEGGGLRVAPGEVPRIVLIGEGTAELPVTSEEDRAAAFDAGFTVRKRKAVDEWGRAHEPRHGMHLGQESKQVLNQVIDGISDMGWLVKRRSCKEA